MLTIAETEDQAMQCRTTSGAAILTIVMACGAVGLPCDSARAAVHKEYSGTVSGVVLDATGQPAAGANVWLVVSQYGVGSKIHQKTAADRAGRFVFPQAKLTLAYDECATPALIARDAQGRIGTALPWPHDAVFGDRPNPNIVIRLLPGEDVSGRLVDEAQKPIVGASIAPRMFSGVDPGCTNGKEVEIFSELSKELTTTTDSDGRFTLHGLPSEKAVAATITAAGFGSPRVAWLVSESPTISLRRPGTLVGKAVLLKDKADAPGVAGVPFYIRLFEAGPDKKWCVEHLAPVVTDKAGQFICKDVPPGDYHIGVLSLGNVAYYVACDPKVANIEHALTVALKPGETSTVAVPLRRAIAIRGRVIDKQTKTGVPGLVVSACCQIGDHAIQVFMATSDAQGKYTIYVVPSGMTTVGAATRTVGDYVIPSQWAFQTTVSEDFECPVIELECGKTVEGHVVDEQGKAVADATVFVENQAAHSVLAPLTTDAAGKFVLQGLPPNEPVHVRAGKDGAVSDGRTVARPGTQSAPLRLAISRKNAFVIRGTCVDEKGRPVPDAEITVSGGRGDSALVQTDAAGQFQVKELWPADSHQLRATADGHTPFLAEDIKGSPGKTHDLGRIRLLSARGRIKGVVVDSQGKPLAGVEVLNRGYTREPPSVTTEASGRFCLDGFQPGPAYVFAVKDGYRFTGVRTASGAGDVVVKLLRKDEPIPPRPWAKLPAVSTADQHRLVRYVVDRLWRQCPSDDDRVQVLLPLALIDPVAAAERAEKGGQEAQRAARFGAALGFADSDMDECLSRMGHDAEIDCHLLASLVERYAVSDPAKAMRCAEEAIVHARAADQPLRTESLAQIAAALGKIEAGRVSGRKLAEEAAEMALAIKSKEKQAELCTPVAVALAAFDVDRAMQFLKSVGDAGLRNPDCLARVAAAGAAVDLKKARKILDDMSKQEKETALARMACGLASTRPAEAKQLLDEVRLNPALKVEALGWYALAAAPRDPRLACSAIDDGLTLCDNPNLQRAGWPHQAIQAAILAVAADQIGYCDMESVLYRVLAARLSCDAMKDENDATALLVSAVDPALAKELLVDAGGTPTPSHRAGARDGNGWLWFVAWAAIDPKQAGEYLERECNTLKAGGPDAGTVQESLLTAAMYLGLSPSDRLKWVASRLDCAAVIEKGIFW
jgi:hypothetical protein